MKQDKERLNLMRRSMFNRRFILPKILIALFTFIYLFLSQSAYLIKDYLLLVILTILSLSYFISYFYLHIKINKLADNLKGLTYFIIVSLVTLSILAMLKQEKLFIFLKKEYQIYFLGILLLLKLLIIYKLYLINNHYDKNYLKYQAFLKLHKRSF